MTVNQGFCERVFVKDEHRIGKKMATNGRKTAIYQLLQATFKNNAFEPIKNFTH
jgi:hypothetical protein